MAELEQDNNMGQEEQIARIVWAAHILDYLTPKMTHADPWPDALEEEIDLEDTQSDLDSERNAVLVGPRRSICLKALDCIAQLLSPSKGWDHVTATGLREQEDFLQVHVTRNDCFGGGHNNPQRFCEMLEKHLSTATHDISSPTASLNTLERLAIEYARARVDHWASKLRAILDPFVDRLNLGKRQWPGRHLAVEAWAAFLEFLYREDSESTETIQKTVHQAYQCVASPAIRELLRAAFEAKLESKVWRALSLLARPITDCRLLHSIAVKQPQFRSIRISPVYRSLTTTINPEYQIDVFDAWTQLMTAPPPALILQKVAKKFRKHCAKSYNLHAESQLFIHYESQPDLKHTLNYFGCSKKACLLCHCFLQSLSEPINTRGAHGICYPAWGVPHSSSSEAKSVLRRFERMIVSRIQASLLASAPKPKAQYAPAVAQSSVVSDLTKTTNDDLERREETLRFFKDQETAHREQRLILEGHAVNPRSEDYAASIDFDPHDSCVMCNTSPAKACERCKSCYYCSKKCQQSDWPSHKLLCKAFCTQAPQPTPSHRRAIFFPAENRTPEMIWLACELTGLSDDGMGEDTRPFEKVNAYPYLGYDKPLVGDMGIEHNPKRGRLLGRGMVHWAPRKEGYSIRLKHRDTFLWDGSPINKSILTSVGTSGQVHHRFCGPIVAIRQTAFETYKSITLADFRHIIDYLVSYATTEVRESSSEPGISSYSMIRGAKICCYGEIQLHGSQSHVSVDIPMAHPIRMGSGDISAISQRLGMPLRLWKDPSIETWLDPPGWSHNIMSATSNQEAAFLMVALDSESWGWAPQHWQTDIGNVIAVRVDDRDLALDDLVAMCYFARRKLQLMFGDAMGAGLVPRTKESVMDFITWENLEKCKAEMGDETESNPETVDND